MKEVEDGLGADGYEVVNVEDIVESIAGYVARYTSSVPQARNLTPMQLQEVMTQAFSDAERKGWLQSLYSTGRFLYTAGSWGVATLPIDKNPVVGCWLILKLITWKVLCTCTVHFRCVWGSNQQHLGCKFCRWRFSYRNITMIPKLYLFILTCNHSGIIYSHI
ncbi:hypothetical protein KC19_4G204300 [Ceratodon purpureus]|uniref:Uncharacterized protein n=1 Tax=Ceratodon purpureus TaxID=3225 RepID=A0A8T0IEC6_CERPU|nr:hypothetical protein KC19_4G204300 [Ceratodon purpureus]